ncbi:MAG: hypothetical protein IAE82_18885 [Opitutaceae bacterium]|nr:hypothetical protein [Opitutaceae bacterium]
MRVLTAFLAAVLMLGSLPLWWWLQQRQQGVEAVPASPTATIDQTLDTTSATTPAVADQPPTEAPAAVPDPTPSVVAEEPIRPAKPVPELVTGPDPGRSPLADRLNAPDGTIELDLAIVHKVLTNYLLEFGALPVGANREITAQLSGRNTRRHAPLPPDLPAISQGGELLDRWGTPFFFHALSAREMEVRSAGPDRELYTADDALWTPSE